MQKIGTVIAVLVVAVAAIAAGRLSAPRSLDSAAFHPPIRGDLHPKHAQGSLPSRPRRQ